MMLFWELHVDLSLIGGDFLLYFCLVIFKELKLESCQSSFKVFQEEITFRKSCKGIAVGEEV